MCVLFFGAKIVFTFFSFYLLCLVLFVALLILHHWISLATLSVTFFLVYVFNFLKIHICLAAHTHSKCKPEEVEFLYVTVGMKLKWISISQSRNYYYVFFFILRRFNNYWPRKKMWKENNLRNHQFLSRYLFICCCTVDVGLMMIVKFIFGL